MFILMEIRPKTPNITSKHFLWYFFLSIDEFSNYYWCLFFSPVAARFFFFCWLLRYNFSYYFIFQANWHRANAFCHSIGMKLVSITSQQKHDKIIGLIEDNSNLIKIFTLLYLWKIWSWIEFDKKKEKSKNVTFFCFIDLTNSDFWISGSRLGYDKFYWMGNGQAFSYTNWVVNNEYQNPDNLTGRQECVGLWARFGLKWDDTECELQKYFICE